MARIISAAMNNIPPISSGAVMAPQRYKFPAVLK